VLCVVVCAIGEILMRGAGESWVRGWAGLGFSVGALGGFAEFVWGVRGPLHVALRAFRKSLGGGRGPPCVWRCAPF
jgi:hypothetical protein